MPNNVFYLSIYNEWSFILTYDESSWLEYGSWNLCVDKEMSFTVQTNVTATTEQKRFLLCLLIAHS
jgi:hypothetical protein